MHRFVLAVAFALAACAPQVVAVANVDQAVDEFLADPARYADPVSNLRPSMPPGGVQSCEFRVEAAMAGFNPGAFQTMIGAELDRAIQRARLLRLCRAESN